jgi:hypothetical protein
MPPAAAQLTRVAVDALAERAEDIARALASRGFTVRRAWPRLLADSASVGAQETRRYLRSLGFHGRDFQAADEDRAAGAPA